MKNFLVAKILYEIADMLEIMDVEFKPQAYRKAAQNIENMTEDIEEIRKKGKLSDIPGVGKSIEEKIEEILDTGDCKYHEDLKKKIPVDFESLLRVEGIGPKTIKILYKKLKIKNIDDLEKAAKEHRIRRLKDFGEKTEQNILENISFARMSGKRILLNEATTIANNIISEMKKFIGKDKIMAVGSLRRRKETIGDIDILVSSNKNVMDYFTRMKDVRKVLGKGKTKSSVLLDNGIRVDIRNIDKNEWGAALLYFTGSKEHNIEIRRIAQKKKYKLNEYGLFKGKKIIASRTEEEIYKKLGMQFVPPELRESRGEVQAALKKRLPNLIGYNDVKGDLQMHTKWSDGSNTIAEMAEKAKQKGYEYICITDHIGGIGVARPLNEKRIKQQEKEIKKAENGIRIFHGAEVDIKKDGTLNAKPSVLKELDIVLAAVHSSFRMSKKDMTQRIARAMENEYVNIIAHPTGRLINKRKGYEIDLDVLIEKSKQTNTFLEINASPIRLDLNDEHVRKCVINGCKLSLGTDAHNVDSLDFMEYGIATARRGWAEKKNIINTLSRKQIEKMFGI